MLQQIIPPLLLSAKALLPTWAWFVFLPLIIFSTWLFWPLPSSKISPQELSPVRPSRFHPDLVPKGKIDTIVIGSGSGGCAVSNLLAQAGNRVLILEQHDRTGTVLCAFLFYSNGRRW
jgi:hypothetical protein